MMKTLIVSTVFALNLGLFGMGATAAPQQFKAGDVAFDKLAYNLELIRNQMELTLSNRVTVNQDLGRQEREQKGLALFLRIPVASQDAKESTVLDSIREDLAKAGVDQAYRVQSLRYANRWKKAPSTVPRAVTFEKGYLAPDDQIVDNRDVNVEIKFGGVQVPASPHDWMLKQQDFVRRLIDPAPDSQWKKRRNSIVGQVKIYRFREFTYPQIVAPDLSRYPDPGAPQSEFQKASHRRITKYRQDIVRLWPKVQPYLDDIRAFAMNDVRMSFFLKHANTEDNGHGQIHSHSPHGGH